MKLTPEEIRIKRETESVLAENIRNPRIVEMFVSDRAVSGTFRSFGRMYDFIVEPGNKFPIVYKMKDPGAD